MSLSLTDVRAHLSGLMVSDAYRLERRAGRAAALRDAGARERALREVLAGVQAASLRVEERRLAVPSVSFPPALPVSQRKDEIARVIRDNQVVIVAGETGSGKTTQLPKICLELGRGVTGQIGHTQPRRIAARTVADRIAAELGTEPGTVVGYKVRFADTSSDDTLIKVMTDGILLTEMHRDPQLLRYDTLIIDEAHERSLNIDFILGYLKRLLPARPDLKVIITSATIDPERFSQHFAGGESSRQSAGGESGKQSAGGESSRQSAGGESGKQSAGGEPSRQSAGSEPSRQSAGGEPSKQSAGGEPSKQSAGGAPVIEVSGRTFPVEVRYRPLAGLDGEEPKDPVQAISDAVAELGAEGPGDILVFLSGEREIRDVADVLAGQAGLDVLPLYARLSAAEQHRVFQPHTGRRVVLATNIAETSLTVPGIKYVIDPGMARISRYSHRTKVQRLPIEPVSKASANQRTGRCGRTSDGICIRLYSEEDFASRPEFTDPEIVRTNLASVILRMAALDLGEVADFPFIDPPESRNVTDGIRLLAELGALAQQGRELTEVGRKLAQLPVDPRLGRMILESGRNGCAHEVLVITSALSIQDPRERPAEAREAADTAHARFAEPGSDFLAFLNLWDYLRDRQRELSASAFRRLCRREYLHYLRVREWQDVYGQLRRAAADVGVTASGQRGHGAERAAAGRDAATAARTAKGAGRRARGTRPRGGRPSTVSSQTVPASGTDPGWRIAPEVAERVHVSLLAGLLSHVGMKETGSTPPRGKRRMLEEFTGARGARFAIFPDSALAKRPPQWVVAAELVETSRLWARTVARIEPEWAEPLAPHLLKRTYSEPQWDAGRGAAMAQEKVTLYGLPIIAARRVSYARIDPAGAREEFIQHALVEGDWRTHHRFFHENRRLLSEAADLERKARRHGIVAGDDAVFGFYDQRIPKHVTSARHFDAWWKKARATDPGLLTLSGADLTGPDADEITAADYPSQWDGFGLSYEFSPGDPGDGVTVDIPLTGLNQVSGEEFAWQVPGLREELVTELIRSLPKHLRRALVPAPETARAVLTRLGPARGNLLEVLSAELNRLRGVKIPHSAWDVSRLPAHLRVTFRVVDGGGETRVLATGKDLEDLRRELRPRLRAELTRAAGGITRSGLRNWDLATLPRVFTDGRVRAYPALSDTGEAADIALFDTREQADKAMWAGTRRLLLIQVPSAVRQAAGRLPPGAKLAMSRHPYESAAALLEDCAACAADQVISGAGGPAWDVDGFRDLLEAARPGLPAATARVVDAVATALGQAHEVEAKLAGAVSPALAPALADIRTQLSGLVYPGFVIETGAQRLPDLTRYLRAIVIRLGKLPEAPGRDADRMAIVHRVTDSAEQAMADLPPVVRDSAEARAVRWMIEELRVSLFAQTLGTRVPVSERRIQAALERLAKC